MKDTWHHVNIKPLRFAQKMNLNYEFRKPYRSREDLGVKFRLWLNNLTILEVCEILSLKRWGKTCWPKNISDYKARGKRAVQRQCTLVCRLLPQGHAFKHSKSTIYVYKLKFNLMHGRWSNQVITAIGGYR